MVPLLFCSLPRPKMIQTDLSRLINSDEIQKVVRPVRQVFVYHTRAQVDKKAMSISYYSSQCAPLSRVQAKG